MENTENTLDRKDLKIRALLERVSEQEERIAELRVDLTLHAQHVQELTELNEVLKSQLQEVEGVSEDEDSNTSD